MDGFRNFRNESGVDHNRTLFQDRSPNTTSQLLQKVDDVCQHCVQLDRWNFIELPFDMGFDQFCRL